MTDQTTDTEAADVAAQAAYLRDQLAVLAAQVPVPLPTAEELAAGATADKVTAARIHAARPGIPQHTVFNVLKALRAVRALDRAPNPDREDRIPLAQLTEDDLELLYDDLDRYTEVAGELNERTTELARQAAHAEAAIARVRALHQPVGVVAATEFGNPPDCAICGPNTWPCPTYNAITDDQPAPTAATQATDTPNEPGTPAHTTGLVVAPYRADDGTQKWVFRCWGTDTCDGWLSLDHYSQQSAERARDRHTAETHTVQPPTVAS